jgi:hypothetical protein
MLFVVKNTSTVTTLSVGEIFVCFAVRVARGVFFLFVKVLIKCVLFALSCRDGVDNTCCELSKQKKITNPSLAGRSGRTDCRSGPLVVP